MKVTLGKEGLGMSWQNFFPEETECCKCKGIARIGFVTHEGISESDRDPKEPVLFRLYPNDPDGRGHWLHDYCAVAVYFCKDCLEATALYNQA